MSPQRICLYEHPLFLRTQNSLLSLKQQQDISTLQENKCHNRPWSQLLIKSLPFSYSHSQSSLQQVGALPRILAFMVCGLVLAQMLLSPKYLRSPCLFLSRLWPYTDTLVVWEHTDYPSWLSGQYSSKRCTVFLARNGASWDGWRVPERNHESGWWTGRVVFVAVLLLQVCLNPSLHLLRVWDYMIW